MNFRELILLFHLRLGGAWGLPDHAFFVSPGGVSRDFSQTATPAWVTGT